jgi:hypothetical protein
MRDKSTVGTARRLGEAVISRGTPTAPNLVDSERFQPTHPCTVTFRRPRMKDNEGDTQVSMI